MITQRKPWGKVPENEQDVWPFLQTTMKKILGQSLPEHTKCSQLCVFLYEMIEKRSDKGN